MSGTHGVFQHRSGYFYTILEEDFCEVYKAPGANEVCRAYITSILEHLTNKQFEATGKDTDIWVYMSLPEMERRMRHACSQRTIHKELQGMIKEGFLFKRRATGKATMEYKLNIKKLRKALEALPEVQSCRFATSYLANLQDQSGKSARLTLQNDKNDLADLQPRIPREETIELPREEERAVRARAFSENEYHFYGEKRHLAWNCHNWCAANGYTCADYQAHIESGQREETPTEPRVEAVKPPVAIASTPGEAAPPNVALTRQSHDGAARGGIVAESRASGNEHTVSVSEHAGSASPPLVTQMPAGVVTWESILADWEAIQGQPQAWTERHYKAARQGVRASPTREELAGCRAWLPTTDNPKTLWYHSHGVELWDVIEKLNAYRSHLALSIEPAPLADMPKPKPMDIYTANSLDKEKMKRRVEEMKANAARKGLHLHGSQ